MKQPSNSGETSIGQEFCGAKLGNQLRTKRLQQIAERLEAQPSKSLPQALGTVADREGTYRFLNNEDVSFDAILAPHFEATARRAEVSEQVLCLHDTTELKFDTPFARKGMGRLRGKNSPQGFRAHTSLVVGLGETREPLGLLAVQPWTRTDQVQQMRRQAGRTEMGFWTQGVELAEERCPSSSLIHVMDRQGDSYDLFVNLAQRQSRFVIRACHNRMLTEGKKLFETLTQSAVIATRSVPLSRRNTGKTLSKKKIYPQRRMRDAELSIGAVTVPVARSGHLSGAFPQSLTLNAVYIVERNPPEGEPAVCWYLLTTEPIDNAEDVLKIVDIYRSRWVVEELFKALKTGCQYQQLQLESYDALLRALAIYLPIAWQLLRLRYLAGTSAEAPATTVFTPLQVEVLRAISDNLPKSPSVRDALLAIAARGGHIPNNKEPGWLVLARGLHDLLLIELGWRAAIEAKGDK